MEYAAGGELYDYLSERKVLVEDEARRIFRQIATASYYCHKHKICHRDLKLENILLDDKCNAKVMTLVHLNFYQKPIFLLRLQISACRMYLMTNDYSTHFVDHHYTHHRRLLKELHIMDLKWTVGL